MRCTCLHADHVSATVHDCVMRPQASAVPWRYGSPRAILAYQINQTAKAERLDVLLNWLWNNVAFEVRSCMLHGACSRMCRPSECVSCT